MPSLEGGGKREGGSGHAQGAHPWQDRQVASNGRLCSDRASDRASWPQFPNHAVGRTTSWMEAEALLCPSVGPDSFFPESLAPAVLYSQTLCLLLKPYPHLHSFRGQLKPPSCPGHPPWLPNPRADLTQQKPLIPPLTAQMPWAGFPPGPRPSSARPVSCTSVQPHVLRPSVPPSRFSKAPQYLAQNFAYGMHLPQDSSNFKVCSLYLTFNPKAQRF